MYGSARVSTKQEQVVKAGTRRPSLQVHEPEQRQRAEKAEDPEHVEQGESRLFELDPQKKQV